MSSYGAITTAGLAMALAARLPKRSDHELRAKEQERDQRTPEEREEIERAMRAERQRIAEMKFFLGYVPTEPLTRQQRRQLERKRAKVRGFSVAPSPTQSEKT